MKKAAVLALALVLAASVSVESAFANDPGVNKQQHNQHGRIKQGVKSGELTRKEGAKLAKEQRQINRTEKRMRADGGGLSAAERARLDNMQDRQSKAIHHQKHDGQDRPKAN